MTQRTLRTLISVLLVALFAAHASRYFKLPLLDRLEAIAYDARIRLSAKPGLDPNVVIIDVDEKSLADEGRWPWPRSRIADLMDQLFDHYSVRIVGLDMVFSEPDPNSGINLLSAMFRGEMQIPPMWKQRLERMQRELDGDARLARAFDGRTVVLGYYFNMGDSGNPLPKAGMLPGPAVLASQRNSMDDSVVDWAGYGANLPVLAQAAPAAGHFNYLPDMDGITRRVPLLARYAGDYYAALSLTMVQQLLGPMPIGLINAQAVGGYQQTEHITLGESLSVPVDRGLNVLVPFRTGAGSYAYVSATDVLHGRIAKAVLEDKIILIGTTAAGLTDLRATPISNMLPGVEVHANLISGLLDGSIKSEPPFALGIELATILIAGALLALILPRAAPMRATIVFLVMLCATVVGNWMAWEYLNWIIAVASGVVLITALYGVNMALGYFEETRSKRLITGLFGQYVPPDLVKQMSKNPDRFTLAGESKELSVLFTDVRGFTHISEGMEPRELTQLMNEFLTPLSRVVYEHRGTIDKYMGDCLMAFWGAPVPLPDHADQAVKAALRMIQEMEALAPRFKARGWPALAIGVGVNTGRVSVGNMGSEIRVAYTVMGDAVNLASRLEGLTKQYGVAIIVGQDTRSKVHGVVFRELDRVKVKGKNEHVAIYEPIGFEESFSATMREELAMWHEALAEYRVREWLAAETLLNQLVARSPQTQLYQIYLSRIATYRNHPPEQSWNGVYAFDTK